MKLFIDTADVNLIREAAGWGILDGCTTNPSHVANFAQKSGRSVDSIYSEILEVCDGPVSLEVIALDAPTMIAEGRKLAKLHRNVVVKVPLLQEGCKAVKVLSKEGIKTNVTVTFSAMQALLAAKCGATYISPFVGRLDMVGHEGMELVQQIKTIYDNYGFTTQVLVAAVRLPSHALQAALLGADCATMGFDVMEQLYRHPLTDVAIDLFMKDWAKIPKK